MKEKERKKGKRSERNEKIKKNSFQGKFEKKSQNFQKEKLRTKVRSYLSRLYIISKWGERLCHQWGLRIFYVYIAFICGLILWLLE